MVSHKAQAPAKEICTGGEHSPLAGRQERTGPLNPVEYFSALEQSEILLWTGDKDKVKEADGSLTTVYYPVPTPGSAVLLPGGSPTFEGLRKDSLMAKLNFLSHSCWRCSAVRLRCRIS